MVSLGSLLIRCMVFSLCFAGAAQAALVVSVDRHSISIQDAVVLTIESTEEVSGEPDIAPLFTDFEILSSSTSSSFSFGTGSGTQRSIKKIYSLQAKRAGSITIPSLRWGALSTGVLALNVSEAGTGPSGAADASDLRVEMEASQLSAYPQQQIILTVKAYSNRQFHKGDFSKLNLPSGTVVTATGKPDEVYQTARNGVNYLVQSRDYILYAERSGTIEIEPVTFQGYFEGGRRDVFGQRQLSAKIGRSNGLTLDVKPVPAAGKVPWLPAKSLSLTYDLSGTEYKAGEPITLTLTTTATGLMAEQLPDVELVLPEAMKSYSDKPEMESYWSDHSANAKRVDKIALIPTRAGNFELPVIEVHWWNTETNQPQVASVGPVSLSVVGEGNRSVTGVESTPTVLEENDTGDEQGVALTSVSTEKSATLWRYLAIGFSLLWIFSMIAAVLLWKRVARLLSERLQSADSLSNKKQPSKKQLSKKRLLKLLQSANAQSAAQHMIAWAQSEVNANLYSMSDLLPYASSALQGAIRELDGALYGEGDKAANWRANTLIDALKSFDYQQPRKEDKESGLPPLYPDLERS